MIMAKETSRDEGIAKQCLNSNEYKVILLNDDFTPMEFVVKTLKDVFHMVDDCARNTMMKTHFDGSCVCGLYSFDIAQTKVSKITRIADQKGVPMKCILERSDN